MNFLCHVNCCNNQGVIPGVTYHKFPKTVAELWFSVHNIPIRKVENVSEMIVCSDHFKLEDYADTEKSMKLKNGAVPSLHLKISKQEACEANISQSLFVSSSKEKDKSCIINNLPLKHDKVTVLQNNNDSALVEKNRDKSLEFIAIADSSDMLTVINSMHNYSISVETHVNTEHLYEKKSAQDNNNLLKEKVLIKAVKKPPCFKNRHKLKNQIMLQKKSKKVASHFKNAEEDTDKMDEEEIIENVFLDHDYTTQEEGELQNINNNAYNNICSENYVWKLKKQLGLYSKKTRLLGKRVDSLKSIVNVLKNRIF